LLSLESVRTALNSQEALETIFVPNASHASVAMILTKGHEHPLEVCFIRRAIREGDPWSGQVAFPGGRAAETDGSPRDVAERETYEEVGLKLNSRDKIGNLPQRLVERNDLRSSLTLSPIVYYVDPLKAAEAKPLQIEEVARVFWVPLPHLFSQDFVTEIQHPMGGQVQTFSGIKHESEVIWGLTLRILHSFSEVVGVPMPSTY
jgi:8-oxo-dGTP pyrophosphatase MutT (NUDIX family)